MSAVAQPAATSAPRWITNAPVDLLIGCGAWTLPLLALTYVASTRHLVNVALLFYVFMLFCNNPHYMATIYRAYGTRDDFARYRVFTVYVTALLGATAVLAHVSPRLLPWLWTAYLTWSPWHYTGQNFGLAMMWARRNGARPTGADRNVLYAAFLASYLAWLLWMHSTDSEDTNVLSLGIPAQLADPVRLALIAVFLAAGVYALTRWVRQSGPKAMLGAMILFSTQGLWFVLPALLELGLGRAQPPAYYSAGVLAFMHCAQYLWITGFYAKRETEAGIRGAGARWNPWRYYLILIVGGIALFIPGPWLISSLFHRDLTDSLLIFAALVNLHHFILDGAVWKLRDGRVAALLLGSRDPALPRRKTAQTTLDAMRWIGGPHRAARSVRWGLVAAMLGVAAVDQAQYFLTLEQTDGHRLDAATRLNRHDTRVLVRRAKLLVDRGDVTDAMAELRHAVELNPRHASALRMLGSLLVQSGQYAQAYAHYNLVEQQVRPDLSTLLNAAVLSAQAGDSRRAEDRLLRALRLDPDHADAHLNLAEVYMARGEFAPAVPHYRAFLMLAGRSGPQRPRLHLLVLLKLGDALATIGQRGEARSALAELRERADQQGESDLASAARARLTLLDNR